MTIIMFAFLLMSVYGVFQDFNGCGTEIHCFKRLLTGSSYQTISVLLIALFLSLLPLYFLKEGVYKTWRNFAMVYLPVAILLIVSSPVYESGGIMGGLLIPTDRETVSMTLSGFFLLISLGIIIYKSIRLWGR